MYLCDLTRRLPVELVSRTFDHLELVELLSVLGVCRRWRTIAIDHPTYWRFIKLDCVSNSAIELFLARLESTRGRPISVEVNVDSPCVRIGSEVLPAVASRLHHTRYLCVGVHEEQADAFISTISLPAPRLEGLTCSIRLSFEATGCPTLPSNLFQDDAPRLQFFGSRNLDLPSSPPRALSCVHDVLFGYSYNEAEFTAFMPLLFSAFPKMRRLTLHCGSLVIPPDSHIDSARAACLEFLECLVHPCSRDDVLAQFPCDIIPVVRVSNPASHTTKYILEMLPRGPLHLAVDPEPDYPDTVFHIDVSSPAVQRQRSFKQIIHAFKGVDRMPHDLFRRAKFLERISSFTISHTFWSALAHLLLPLPQLSELTLTFSGPLGASKSLGSGSSISCPRLRRICLTSDYGAMFIRTALLADFVASSLNDVSLPISLRTIGIILEGPQDVLRDIFKDGICNS